MNLVYALQDAVNENDVLGVPGRIVKYYNKIKISGFPTLGASRHVARAVLVAMKFNPNIRSAINIKYDDKIIEIAKRLGFKVSMYDRRLEPPEIKAVEGMTIKWGIEEAIKKCKGEVPDIIYHLGDWGKEPMILIFGRDPIDVVNKLLRIVKYRS